MKLRRSVPLWVVPITFFSALGLGVAWKKYHPRENTPSPAPEIVYIPSATHCEEEMQQDALEEAPTPLGVTIQADQPIYTTSHSYDGQWLAGLETGRLTVWDAHTGRRVHSMKVSEDVQLIPFSPEGDRILLVGPKEWKMIQWRDGKTLFTAQVPQDKRMDKLAYFTPNGQWIVATGWPKNEVKLLDAFTGKIHQVLEGHESEVVSVDIAPHTQRIVTATRHKIRLFDASTGKLLTTIAHKPWKEGSLTNVGISRNERWLVANDIDFQGYLIDLNTKKVVYEIPEALFNWTHEDPFSPDGSYLAVMRNGEGDEGIIGVFVIDTSTHETVFEVRGTDPVWSEDGEHLLTKEDGALLVWDPQNGHLLDTLVEEGKETPFSQISHGHQGAILAFPYEDLNQVRIFWPGTRQTGSYQ